jgi:chromosome partitioning related protein ParA
MIVITIVATKGGVGKTTVDANLGALLADMGVRVLLIDADIQPSLTRYYPIHERAQFGLTEIIKRGVISPDCISRIDLRHPDGFGLNPDGCLDIVVANAPEGTLQDWLAQRIDRAVRIRKAVRSPYIDESYDVVLIDTQGAVGHLQDAAVLAADVLLSPVSPDILTAREFTSGTLELLNRLEPSADIGITVPPMKALIYKLERTKDSRDIAKSIRDQYVNLRARVDVLDTTIPHAVAYKQAATAQLPVHWTDPVRAGTAMHQLVWELIPSLAGSVAPNCVSVIDVTQFADSAADESMETETI